MKDLAIVTGLWVSLGLFLFGCDTNRKGLGTGGGADGGTARGGAGGGAGGASGTGGAIAAGGAAANAGRDGSAGATAAGGGPGSTGGSGTGGAVASGGRVGSGGASSTGGTAKGGAGGAGTGGPGTGGAGTGGASGGRGGSGGASPGGGTIGSGGAAGGTGTGPPTGGASGSGGSSAELQPCTSSDGSGCGDSTFCVDTRSDTCSPDTMSGCTGFCAGRRRASPCAGLAQNTPCPDGFACLPDPRTSLGTDPVSICVGSDTWECTTDDDCPIGFFCLASPGGSRCSPDRVVCEGAVVCKRTAPDPCRGGYARSTPDGCYGPCVPVELCACSTDAECATAEASCDRKQGRCYIPRSPEPRCQLPFDIGPCDGAMRAFAFIDGECKPATYGGCGGNDNRFSTLEECLSRCQGMPGERPCPEGRAERLICLACGVAGGCIQLAGVCAKTCTAQADCQSAGFSCADGYCEAAFCI